MDKSLHNQMYGLNRSQFTSKLRQSPASGRKSIHGGGTSGVLKKGSVSGRFSVSGRSTQSQFIAAKSDCNLVESYGAPLPVMVNEALTFGERNCSVSVNCGNNGWAWAVSGRRLLVWQFKDNNLGSPKSRDIPTRTPQRRTTTSQCRELTLPHCDIGHKATLIKVFMSEGQQMASCLAVSPTGDIRYWPSIAHDGSSIDVTGLLDGQEFDNVFSIPQQGYVLVTTTCNLVLVEIHTVNGRPVIQHKAVKSPTGFFGGIGKKFASIIIGMNSAQDKENKFVKIDGIKYSAEDWKVILLADRWIQFWNFSSNAPEKFLFEDHELPRKIRDEFQKIFWNGRELNEIDITMLDMVVTEEHIFILCGAVNNCHTPQMHYAITVLQSDVESIKITSFIPLKLSHFYSTGTHNECMKINFIINRGIAYLYGDKTIYPVNLSNPSALDLDSEKVEFQSSDDKIMNASLCGQLVIFFTRSHGLVCVTPSDFDNNDFLNVSYTTEAISSPFSENTLQSSVLSTNDTASNLYELDPDEIYNGNKDSVSRVKAAFIYNLKRNTKMCHSILKDLFDTEDSIEVVDAVLDKTVIRIAEDLAEDIPAADPRWEHHGLNSKYALGSSSSMQILTQLKEKSTAMNHFVEFLQTTELWNKLNCVSHHGSLKSTCHILSDISEKLTGAIGLKYVQSNFPRLVDEAIQDVLSDWNENPTGNLMHQDLFYVRITKFQHLFGALADIADKKIESQLPSSTVVSTLCDINRIVISVITEVNRFREGKLKLYALPTGKNDAFEYQPWTAMSGKNGLRDNLLHLANTSLKFGARSTGEPELKQEIYQQLVDLIDFILGGRKAYLDSVKDIEKHTVLQQQFESQRRDLIFPLVEDEQFEMAAKLAEKYLDFHILVVICDRTENQQRLDMYIVKYQEFDFSQFAINWHLRKNRKGDLFEKFKSNQAALSQFLGDHPSLAWIQLMFNGDFDRASKILFQLAQDETEYCARKKSMLSLAKLAALAADSDMSAQITEINSDLNLLDYQNQIPDNMLQNFGYDIENPKVLKPEEIIHLLIAEENDIATEFEYRKALELLMFVEDPYEVRHKIWCSAILRDSWTDYDMNAPLERIQNMIFFKLIEVCYLIDGDLDEFLPPMSDFLCSPDLGEIIHNKSFEYLLKLGYEHVADNFQKKDGLMDHE